MKFLLAIISTFLLYNISYSQTVTELLAEAQNSIKEAYDAHSNIKSPYEYSKALTFYEIAKEETSKLNIETGKAASLKAIEWALRAISNSYTGGEQ